MGRPRTGYELDGEPVPGTTTICGQLDKPALPLWGFKKGKEAKTCELGLCRHRPDDNGEVHHITSLYSVTDEAKHAGTLAHEHFEKHLSGNPPSQPAKPSKVEEDAWRAYDNAVLWLSDTNLAVEAYERPLVSRTYRYGGTPDAIGCNSRGDMVLLDWKSGGGSLYPEHLLQMAAYRHLLLECEGMTIAGAHLVKFQRDSGGFAHFWLDAADLDLAWETFTHLLAIYPLMQRLKKRTK